MKHITRARHKREGWRECVVTGKDVVAKVMKLRGMSSPVLAEKLGYTYASGVTERLRVMQDMRADTLAKFLEAMDCEIIVRSKLDDRSKWVIDGEPEKKEKSK